MAKNVSVKKKKLILDSSNTPQIVHFDSDSDDENECLYIGDLIETDINEDVSEEFVALEHQSESLHFQNFLRPALKNINNQEENLLFQQFDIDHYVVDSSTESASVFRLYGVNKDGNSVMAHVHGFHPYFFMEVVSEYTADQCLLVLQRLTHEIKKQAKYKYTARPVLSVSHCLKSNIYYYNLDNRSPFLKVEVAWPPLVALCRRLLNKGLALIDNNIQQYKVYDTNVDFCIRYMVDSGMVGACWLEVQRGLYTVRSENRGSLCQLEVDVTWKDVIVHDWSDIAPIRVLSFDIECLSRGGLFSDPEKDAVIQIANIMTRYGDVEPFLSIIFTLNKCDPVVGSRVICHETEMDLLKNWSEFVRAVDPDIITGFKVQDHYLPFLMKRSEVLKIEHFPLLGRVKGVLSAIKESKLQSKQLGPREHRMVHIKGRIQLDLLQVLLRDHKLRSYSLNAVSYHFLRETKQDFSQQIITDLQNEGEITRRRLAQYCVKKCALVLRLLNKLMCLVNYIELARVTGVPLSYLLSHGQQIKVLSQLLRKAGSQGFVLPDYEVKGGEQYPGGYVLEPKRGFYNEPITVLDFASLYPSIMMAHNLCYTTLVKNRSFLETAEEYTHTPHGSHFVKSNVKRGLLPEILTELIEARKKAKRELAQETDTFRRQVLDGRQLALKLSANSVYGFTGAQIGRLPCIDISASVTAFGREMLKETISLVEGRFCTKNGYAHNVEVVYGDTDSLMLKFGVATVAEAISLGKEAAQFVSSKFSDPIKLEFEQVFHPFLLISKKRYAGLPYTKPDKHDKVVNRGLESVRRDSCLLASNLVTACIERLLLTGDANLSIEYSQSVISDLLCNRVDLSQLIISKQVCKTDKEYGSSHVAHAVLKKKMATRDKGSCPQLGDRVAYIVIAGREKGISSRAEDPIVVSDNSLPIDTEYYLHNQLIGPLIRIFEPIFGAAVAKSKIINGPHMRSRTQQHSGRGPISSFIVIRETCIGCKKVLSQRERSICDLCRPKAHILYHKEAQKLVVLETRFSKLWSQCQRCSGSLLQEVMCSSRDCPIFFMRKKVQTDVIHQNRLVSKLDVDLDW